VTPASREKPAEALREGNSPPEVHGNYPNTVARYLGNVAIRHVE